MPFIIKELQSRYSLGCESEMSESRESVCECEGGQQQRPKWQEQVPSAVVAQRRCPSCLLGRTRSRRPPSDREPPEEPRRSPTHPASAPFGALRALNLQISRASHCVCAAAGGERRPTGTQRPRIRQARAIAATTARVRPPPHRPKN